MKITKKLYALMALTAIPLCITFGGQDAQAQAVEPPTVINPLRKHEPLIKQSATLVEQTEEQLAKESEEIEAIEEKKETLAEELERMKREIEEMKQKVAEKKAAEARAAELASVQATVSVSQVSTTSIRGAGGPNAYGWGQCTWYVKNRRPDIGGYWGNANAWVYSAQAAGYSTGYAPVVGAIGSENGGMHVVYVESVNGDGTVNISEMNYAGGVGVVHYRTAPASSFTYIY